jgi:hypothetical protein
MKTLNGGMQSAIAARRRLMRSALVPTVTH